MNTQNQSYTPEQIEFLKKKIAANIVEEGDCHVWTLCLANAAPVVNTPREIGRKSVRVRKFLFEFVWGKRKPGKSGNGRWFPATKCGNPKCLNEEHNAWATASIIGKMTADRVGYHLNPARNAKISNALGRRKLTNEQVAAIRASEASIKQKAREYGMSFQSMRCIVHGYTYKDYSSPWAGLMR